MCVNSCSCVIISVNFTYRRKFMQSRKILISVSGVVLFLLAGAISMYVLPSESPAPVSSPQPQAQESRTPQPVPQPTPKPTPEPPKPPQKWYVHISGAVKNPGVYPVPENSRIFQAVNMAGGLTKNADDSVLNLADFLADGVHIHIPEKPAPNSALPSVRVPGLPASTTLQVQAQAQGGLIDINRATVQELERLKGVGPAIAKRIVEYRQAHGAFTRPEDLLNVRGIGKAKLSQLRPQITLTGGGVSSVTRPAARTQTQGGLIDINHASAQELERLKGVGPAIAKRIVEYRQAHGSFTRPEDLLNVRGIGAAKLNQIRPQIVIQ